MTGLVTVAQVNRTTKAIIDREVDLKDPGFIRTAIVVFGVDPSLFDGDNIHRGDN